MEANQAMGESVVSKEAERLDEGLHIDASSPSSTPTDDRLVVKDSVDDTEETATGVPDQDGHQRLLVYESFSVQTSPDTVEPVAAVSVPVVSSSLPGRQRTAPRSKSLIQGRE